jgi:hypothetical protein
MSHCVYCIARDDRQAIHIATGLQNAGVDPGDISIIAPDPTSRRDLVHENATKAPEGAATGASAGALLGGAVGWLAGIGSLAIPGLGPLIAAGPILSALSGLAVGGTIGGIGGALVGLGIPEYEAQQYAGKLKKGRILMCIHAEDYLSESRIRDVLSHEHAEDISTGSEAPVPRR